MALRRNEKTDETEIRNPWSVDRRAAEDRLTQTRSADESNIRRNISSQTLNSQRGYKFREEVCKPASGEFSRQKD